MKKKLTYKSSGVDIAEADRFVKAIGDDVKSTMTSAVLRRTGAFASLVCLDTRKYKKPVIASSTDGVGTKLILAQTSGIHDTVGIDLVAMNVNDVLCVGAEPLFFLDYIACGKVKTKVLQDVIKGITEGCRQAGCSLTGGETAEMPGLYGPDEYDLAGFAVGVVEEDKIIDGSKIKTGDVMIGIPSSGLHSNGYSLVRKALTAQQQKKMIKELLIPTRIYAREVKLLKDKVKINGIAHITGGAYYEKLTKILPKGKCFRIDRCWPVPAIFQLIQKQGGVSDAEMFRTFNMGIGMVFVLDPKEAVKASKILSLKKIRHHMIGKVINDSQRKVIL